VVFEVGDDAQTDVVVAANLEPDGWNVACATGVAIPGTDSASPVAPSMTSSVLEVSEEWNPILAEARAKAAPPTATCPEGTDPNTPGPADQQRPAPGPWNNQSAVFDRHAGRVVFVDEGGETWTFDVCTNTWQQTDATWDAYSLHMGELVYDVDSDRTVAVGQGGLAVYDVNTNAWTPRSAPAGLEFEAGAPGLGTVYDPSSGLILLLTDDGTLVAYDLESDEWTPIGPIGDPSDYPPFMVGYQADIDGLIFLAFQGSGSVVDLRDGSSTTLGGPRGGVAGGFGSFTYATGGDTAYVWSDRPCRLEDGTQGWTCASTTADGAPSLNPLPSAMVVDPINERLILFHDSCCLWPGSPNTDDVWAIDMETGEWTQLLAPSSP